MISDSVECREGGNIARGIKLAEQTEQRILLIKLQSFYKISIIDRVNVCFWHNDNPVLKK